MCEKRCSRGFTASDNPDGYSHSPTNDLGVISPPAAVSSLPLQLLRCLQRDQRLVRKIIPGHRPMIATIENHRTALLWNLCKSATEVKNGLRALSFLKE